MSRMLADQGLTASSNVFEIADEAARACGRFGLPYEIIEPAVVAVDFVILLLASIFSGLGYHWVILGHIPPAEVYLAQGVLAFVIFASIMWGRGDYRVRNLMNLRREVRDATFVWLGLVLVLLGVAFSLKVAEDFSRGATATFFLTALFCLYLWRWLLARFLERALANGAFARRKIIVLGEQAELASSRAMAELQRCGFNPVKIFEIGETKETVAAIPRSLRRTLDLVTQLARTDSIDAIFLAIGWERARTIEIIVSGLSVLPIPVRLLPDENVTAYLGRPTLHVGKTWSAELKRAPLSWSERAFKRFVDVALGCLALVMLFPLLLISSLLIKMDSPGPVLFLQRRNGFNGRTFRIIKFRTMNVLEDGPLIQQVGRRDPRVTRIGRILRRTNIDELPQLINVLRGEMSLIGPRPHAAAHNNEYEKSIATYAFRYHVKPGITGWAQVNGYRGETSNLDLMRKRIEFDLWYINHWSVWLDLKILIRTLTLGIQNSAY